MHVSKCYAWRNNFALVCSDYYLVVFKGPPPPPHVKLQVWSFFCLFLDLQIDEVEEVSLSANQKKSEMRKKLQWHIEGAAAAGDNSHKNTPHGDPMIKNTPRRDPMIKNSSCGDPMIRTKYMVVLAPMEIKTFLIEFWIISTWGW